MHRCVRDQQKTHHPGGYGERCPQPRPAFEEDFQPGPSWQRHHLKRAATEL